MKKNYEAPHLFIDYFCPDTMIASGMGHPKNGNADNNQNCWGCRIRPGDIDGENACAIIEGTVAYSAFCE